MNLKKMTTRGKITIAIMIMIIFVIISLYFSLRKTIVLKAKEVNVEINEEYAPLDNIKVVRHGSLDDVIIDDSQVNYSKLGSYQITYQYHSRQYLATINIVDTTKPVFEVNDLDIDLNGTVDPSRMVSNIVDATNTTITFKEEYHFDQVGSVEVVIQVCDEADNISEKTANVNVIKDEEAPIISNLDSLTVTVGNDVDYNQGVTIIDNLDPDPVLIVDSTKVNLEKVGTYQVIYHGSDRSGNQVEKKRQVKVVASKKIGTDKQSNQKIVYLTFDDGPSKNTQKILDLLDQYKAKATFFVSGNNQNYNYMIKKISDKKHAIGLHSYSHDIETIYSSVDNYFEDLNQISSLVTSITGKTSKYVRLIDGSGNTTSKKYCLGIMSDITDELIERGYQYYDWNVNSGDYGGNEAVSTIVSKATDSQENNIIILFHDSDDNNTTIQALPQIIEYYRKKGYIFKAIDDKSYVSHQNIKN